MGASLDRKVCACMPMFSLHLDGFCLARCLEYFAESLCTARGPHGLCSLVSVGATFCGPEELCSLVVEEARSRVGVALALLVACSSGCESERRLQYLSSICDVLSCFKIFSLPRIAGVAVSVCVLGFC